MTTKPEIGKPPSSLGACQLTLAFASAAAASTLVGALGAVPAPGVTALDAADAGPSPAGFDAVTRKV